MRVSVGLPFYNASKTLPDAIRSVFAQTFSDWELLLINDGSNDDSLEIANTIARCNLSVRIFGDTANKGLPYRLNQIAQLAEGEYIARMDADDLMHPERLARQVKYLDNNKSVHVLGTGMCSIDSQNRPVGLRAPDKLDLRPASVLKKGLFSHATIMGRREWFRLNPYNEALKRAQDHELWCRTCRQNVFAKIQEPLYFYRENSLADPQDYLRSYIKSCQQERRILSLYGPSTVGKLETAILVLKSFFKADVYRLFTLLGLQNMLIKARNIRISESQYESLLQALNTVLQTPVAGLKAA